MQVGSNRYGVWAGSALAVALATVLSGCANLDVFTTQGWFSKPFDLFGRSGGYTFSELQESRKDHPITAIDLVDGSGACPPLPPPVASANPDGSAPASPEAPSLLGEGISLGMSECDVVYRAGPPAAVQLGNNPNGDRTAVLTFNAGPRPGIYRFEGGRLMEMDRVAEPPPAPKDLKKKPAKSKKPKNKDQA